MPPPLGEDLGEVGLQRGGGGDPALPVVDHIEQLDRQPLEPRVILARQAHDPGDDLYRKRESELAGQLGPPARREPSR